MAEAGLNKEAPMMFHYLFQMHKEGTILLSLELNVPTTAFEVIHANSLLSLEAMLRDYGLRYGFLEKSTVSESAIAQAEGKEIP